MYLRITVFVKLAFLKYITVLFTAHQYLSTALIDQEGLIYDDNDDPDFAASKLYANVHAL